MTKLQYNIHILLHSKYRFLFYILIYIIIVNIYYTSFNDITLVECMKENNIDQNSSKASDTEYIQYLEQEVWKMDKRIDELQLELKDYKTETNDRATVIEDDMKQMRADNIAMNNRMNHLEENDSRLAYYLSFCNIL